MPLELGSALSIERETVTDPEIRVQALDAIYLVLLQVRSSGLKASYLQILHFLMSNYWLVSIFFRFAVQEAGRRAFWSINGPRILQLGYEDEQNPQVVEAFERVGSLVHNTAIFPLKFGLNVIYLCCICKILIC